MRVVQKAVQDIEAAAAADGSGRLRNGELRSKIKDMPGGKMKKIGYVILALIFYIFPVFLINAEEYDPEEVPPGMEVVYIGKTKAVVPKGSQLHKQDGFMTLESTGEYVSRRFLETEKELTLLKEKDAELMSMIEGLKNAAEKDAQKTEGEEIRNKRIYGRIAELEARQDELKIDTEKLKKDVEKINKDLQESGW